MRFLHSKITAWAALFLVVLIIALTFSMRPVWWAYTDLFFMFMAAFCNTVAQYLRSLSAASAHKLETCAMIFGILTAIAIIGEYIAFQYIG